jgi:DNA repair exonuclease SbcCD ATPase subunit
MSRDGSGQSITDLPEGVGDWIAEIAREQDVSEEELLSRLLGAGNTETAEVRDRIESVQSDLAGLENRIDDLDADLEEKVSDVRERVIQVKREADAKADADHGHPDLVSDLGDLAAEVDALESRVEASISEVTAETEKLSAEVDDLDSEVTRKLNVLGTATVELRDQIRTLLTAREERAILEKLQTEANRNGIKKAKCESCSNGVRVGLLAEPRCPHCEEPFNAVEPKDGFFGSNVLKTGRAPALEGEVEGTGSGIDDLVGE